jgi:hypothetical protein
MTRKSCSLYSTYFKCIYITHTAILIDSNMSAILMCCMHQLCINLLNRKDTSKSNACLFLKNYFKQWPYTGIWSLKRQKNHLIHEDDGLYRCGREMGDYKPIIINSSTVFTKLKNIILKYTTKLITFWTRCLQGDLHPCANTPLTLSIYFP